MPHVLVLGGSGFVGRAFCEMWCGNPALTGWRLRIPTRGVAQSRHLLTWPTVDLIQASVHDDASLARLLEGVDTVVNLVAILHGKPADFDRVHVQLPRRLAQACVKAGVKHMLHISALGVSENPADASSHYLRSKAQGEQVLRDMARQSFALTVLRPSVIFGRHDRFLNVFAALQAFAPFVPLAASHAQFQPVWVQDVARAMATILQQPRLQGQTYECAGPDILTLADLVRLAGQYSGHPRRLVPVPLTVGYLQAAILGCLPGNPLMSSDNLDSMQVANIATGSHLGLEGLGIVPASVYAIAPGYL